jgi:hypothetical protein
MAAAPEARPSFEEVGRLLERLRAEAEAEAAGQARRPS